MSGAQDNRVKLRDSKRVAKNTIFLYCRMIITMAIGIYTSRVVLSTLGETDYGIYNVVGGFVAMFMMVSASMAAAVQRFLSYEIGKGGEGNVKNVFSNAIIIHLALAVIVLLIAETVGLWFVNNKLNIPADRYYAANVVYQFSVVTFLFNVISVPYNAALIAFEKMKAFAYITIVESVLKLLIVYMLLVVCFDRLITYGFLCAVVAIVIRIIYSVYVKRNIPECKCDWKLHKGTLGQMVSFAGWNMFGTTAGVANDQGINMVLNFFWGVTINAARGISMQVYAALKSFISNFQLATSPQIIKLYAARQKDEMMSLLYKTARFSFILMMILGLPVIFNVDFILNLWLVSPPQHSNAFVQILMFSCLVYSLSQPLSYAMHASGKVRNYQIVVGLTSLMCLPSVYVVLKLGGSPESAFLTVLCFEMITMLAKLIMLRTMIGLSLRDYLHKVVLRSFLLLAIILIAPYLFGFVNNGSIAHFIVSSLVCEASVLGFTILFGVSKDERKSLILQIKKRIRK